MNTQELYHQIYVLQKEATKVALDEVGLLRPEISQAEAFRIYTRGRVEQWIHQGLRPSRQGKGQGGTKWYKREDLVLYSLKTQ